MTERPNDSKDLKNQASCVQLPLTRATSPNVAGESDSCVQLQAGTGEVQSRKPCRRGGGIAAGKKNE